ncbi:hypothetical protein GN244_ATG02559 [Phytophthora infestans]|uniref:Uncharacterized protein n=1 Tax=Phytophthora infestans TaxID=4787 RepID=A0A833TKZ9_PHYIN|nr:hypothetical protein GN244_ATG02559 [Phytophthora infestans]
MGGCLWFLCSSNPALPDSIMSATPPRSPRLHNRAHSSPNQLRSRTPTPLNTILTPQQSLGARASLSQATVEDSVPKQPRRSALPVAPTATRGGTRPVVTEVPLGSKRVATAASTGALQQM